MARGSPLYFRVRRQLVKRIDFYDPVQRKEFFLTYSTYFFGIFPQWRTNIKRHSNDIRRWLVLILVSMEEGPIPSYKVPTVFAQ